MSQAWLKPVPAPRTRHEVAGTCRPQRRAFTDTRPAASTPFQAPKVCRMCHNTSVPCHHLLFDALVCKYVSRATMCRGPWQRPCYRTVPVAQRTPSDEPHTNRSPLVPSTRRSASRRPAQKHSRTIPLGLPPNERVLQEPAVCEMLDERRRAVADDAHEQDRVQHHQLPARPRSLQQQVEHVHPHMVVRLVAQQLEQQRQLEFTLPSCRGRF